MGWWDASPGFWGDEVADIMDDALDKICEAFMKEWQRNPTMGELIAGLGFSQYGQREYDDTGTVRTRPRSARQGQEPAPL